MDVMKWQRGKRVNDVDKNYWKDGLRESKLLKKQGKDKLIDGGK